MRIAGRLANPRETGASFRARGQSLAALPHTTHPHLARRRDAIEHLAHMTLRAGGMLAIGAVHLHASRGVFLEPDALLTRGTTSGLARRKAERLGDGVGTEEARRAILRRPHATRTTTPALTTAAQQPGPASLIDPAGKFLAPLAFLASAWQDTEAHQRAVLAYGSSTADSPVFTVRIRHALTVGADGVPGPRVQKAAQGSLTLGVARAGTTVGLQVPALRGIEHRDDAPSGPGLGSQHAAQEKGQRHQEERRANPWNQPPLHHFGSSNFANSPPAISR
jgi:hypothetical protein